MGLYRSNKAIADSVIYVPSPDCEINWRWDMKEGCAKFGDSQILTEDETPVQVEIILIGTQDFYGRIGQLNYDTSWVKLLFIPVGPKHIHIPEKPSVCSVYLRGDSRRFYENTEAMMPTKGIDLRSWVFLTKSTKVKKSYVDKLTGQPGQGDAKALNLVPVQRLTEQHAAILKAVEDEWDALTPKLEMLLSCSSGHPIIELTGDAIADAKQKRMLESAFEMDAQIEQLALPPGQTEHLPLPNRKRDLLTQELDDDIPWDGAQAPPVATRKRK